MKTKYLNNHGRKPKSNPCRHRHSFNLNDEDNTRLLNLFEESGMKNKANFITSCLFGKPIKVVKLDKAVMDYYMRLTTFHSQFRAIGNNYNQLVRTLKTTFGEKKALAFLYKLEKATIELVELNSQIIQLTEEFEARWLQK